MGGALGNNWEEFRALLGQVSCATTCPPFGFSEQFPAQILALPPTTSARIWHQRHKRAPLISSKLWDFNWMNESIICGAQSRLINSNHWFNKLQNNWMQFYPKLLWNFILAPLPCLIIQLPRIRFIDLTPVSLFWSLQGPLGANTAQLLEYQI